MAPYVQQTKNPVQIAGSGVHPTREGVVPGGPLSLLHPPKPTAVARPLVVRLSVGSGMSRANFTVWTIYTGRKGAGGGRTREHDGTTSPALSVGKSEMPSIDDGRFVPLAKQSMTCPPKRPPQAQHPITHRQIRGPAIFSSFSRDQADAEKYMLQRLVYGAYHGNVVLSEKCYPHGSLIECRPQKKALETLFAGKPKKLRSRCDLQKGWPVKKWMRRNCNVTDPQTHTRKAAWCQQDVRNRTTRGGIQLQASVHPRGQLTRTYYCCAQSCGHS